MTVRNGETVNETQKNYWSDGPGGDWVAYHDVLTRLMQNVTDALVDRVAPRSGERILDIGCGAGSTSIAFAHRVGANGSVLGADISETLLQHARTVADEADVESLEFVYADAQTHEFDNAAFDHLVSRFGVMFFADPVAALENMRRALRSGGRLCFACWAPAAGNPWFRIPSEAAIARLGKPAPAVPHAAGPLGFADDSHVLGLLRAAGYSECNADLAEIDLCPPGDIADVTRLACELGPAVRIIDELEGDDDDRRAIAEAIADKIAQFQTDEGIKLPSKVWFYTAANG